MKKILFLIVLSSSYLANSQASKDKSVGSTQINQASTAFLKFVNENALSIVKKSQKTESIKLNGVVVKQNSLFLDLYKLTPQEQNVQYFTIEGSDEILKVESMFRLRIMFNSQQNIK